MFFCDRAKCIIIKHNRDITDFCDDKENSKHTPNTTDGIHIYHINSLDRLYNSHKDI